MKTLFATLFVLSSFSTFAANAYDNQVTNCRKGAYKLTIEGKRSLFDSRNIIVTKDNQILVDETYQEKFFPYSDRHGSSVMGDAQYRDIMSYAYKTRPRSMAQDKDYRFRVSNNTIVLHTYSSLQPEFGGDRQAIILELVPYKTFVVFDLFSQCKITR
jgi:hypothetical protein